MARQPALLPEGPYGQVEQRFIELSPADLWPEAQNTNFGNLRKVATDVLQDKVNELTLLWFNMFPDSADKYLNLWEEEYDLPVAPTGKSLAERRSYLLARVRHGPFTRLRVRDTIAGFVTATFGDSIALVPEGIAIPVGGLPLYSGIFDLIGAFRVYEDPRNFTYEIWLKTAISPDIARMTRELNRITPAGIQFTIDNTHVDVLDYFRLVRNVQPVHYIRDNTGTDQSGYADNGTVTAVTALAAPGLLHTNVAGGNAGLTFNGTTAQISVPDANQLDVADLLTWEAIVKPSALPTAGNFKTLATKGAGAFQIRIDSTGKLSLWKNGTGQVIISTIGLSVATTYHVRIRKIADKATIRINGVDRSGALTNLTLVDTSSAYVIGSNGAAAEFYAGDMDEIALYNIPLRDFDSDDHNSTRQDIATY